MNFIKMMWPSAFLVQEKDMASLVINLVSFLILLAVFGLLMWLLSGVLIVGILFLAIGSLVEFYGLIGIVVAILRFVGIIK